MLWTAIAISGVVLFFAGRRWQRVKPQLVWGKGTEIIACAMIGFSLAKIIKPLVT